MTDKLYIMPDFTYSIIHQDFLEQGFPMVEVYSDRDRKSVV